MQKVKTITIKFEQSNSYRTLIAHKYYIQSLVNNNILLPSLLDDIRIDGTSPTVEKIGITYDPITGVFKQPVMDSNYSIPNTKDLFIYNSIDNIELLNAYRYQIGIRSIEFGTLEFMETGTYISTIYKFNRAVNRISIIADDEIPTNFNNNINTYIKYSISINNGKSWTSIIPFRNNTIGDTLTITASKNIRVKIELNRDTTTIGNTTVKYLTPIVYQYSIKGGVV